MAKINCDVELTDVENDNGTDSDGVVLTCQECDHQTESCGTGPRSIRRCLALMREECPNDANNFYVAEGSED
jgi:hypothetical protein